MCFLILYIVSAFFFPKDNIANMSNSDDSSSSSEESINSPSEEEIDSLSPMKNGLTFAPRCDGQCFIQQAECDHTIQFATLNKVGEYVVFPSMWYHHGYYNITPRKTVIQAQLFTMHSHNPTKERLTRNTTTMNSLRKGRVDRTSLDRLTKDIVDNWNTTYSEKLFPTCSLFDGEAVDKDKNRHIYSDKFDNVPRIRELVQIFEEQFEHLRVDSVWLLKKKNSNDGFQGWHRDFALGQKITMTIVVNVGCVEDDVTDHDPVGISVRKGKEMELRIPCCQYCKNGIPHNRWRVLNKVERKRGGYNVMHTHIWCAKLALSDDEFKLLLRWLKSSRNTEIKEHQSAWIQSMHQGMGKGAETGATRRSSHEWFKMQQGGVKE